MFKTNSYATNTEKVFFQGRKRGGKKERGEKSLQNCFTAFET